MAANWVDILVSGLKIIFATGFFVWILYLIIYALRKIFNKQRRLWFTYKILKKQYKEKDVAWCMGCLERDLDEIDVRKHLLLKGIETKRIEEIVFIFEQIRKEMMKGGDKRYAKQTKRGYEEIELPKIERQGLQEGTKERGKGREGRKSS